MMTTWPLRVRVSMDGYRLHCKEAFVPILMKIVSHIHSE